MGWFRNFKYPKLFLLIVFTILAYFLFTDSRVSGIVSHLGTLGYLGVIISGFFFSFGFTSPFSAGFFITLNPSSIYLAAILGGFGALIADLIIFKFIRFSFMDEFGKLKRTRIAKGTSRITNFGIIKKIKMYFLFAFAGILIASPLPDEAGIIVLAGLTKIKPGILAIIGFVLNTLGIFVLLSI